MKGVQALWCMVAQNDKTRLKKTICCLELQASADITVNKIKKQQLIN